MNLKKNIFIFICITISSIYILFLLTLGDFNLKKEYSFSHVFFDMWNHISRLDPFLSSEVIGDEGFLINGKVTAYFLPFPAFIRGIQSLFGFGIYSIPSVLLASILFVVGSLAAWSLINPNTNSITYPNSHYSKLVIGFISLNTPIISLATYSVTYWEAMIWGISLFLLACCLSIHLLKSSCGHDSKILILFSVICGMTLFTRPTFSLASCVLYFLSIATLIYRLNLYHHTILSNVLNHKKIIYSIIIFTLFLSLLLILNYAKWGNPFEFQNLQYYKLMSESEKIEFFKNGVLNLNRILNNLSYYLLPSKDNILESAPFISLGNSNYFPNVGKFIYREPTLPLPLIMPVYFCLFIAGIILFLKSREFFLIPAAISSFIPCAIILTMHAQSIRYTGDFFPLIMLFSLYALAYIGAKSSRFLYKYLFTSYLFVAIAFVTTLYLLTTTVMLGNNHWREVFVKEPLKPLEMNSLVTFEFRGNNPEITKYLRTGWSLDLESWGTWSSGNNATLLILPPLHAEPKNNLLLVVKPFVVPEHSTQKIDIYVDGIYNQTAVLSNPNESTITINLLQNSGFFKRLESKLNFFLERITNTRFKQDPTVISFHFLNPATPKNLGYGSDDRLLSIGLIALKYQ